MSDITSSNSTGGGGSPIGKEQAAKMIHEYKEKRLKLIDKEYGIKDTKSVWFKREVFEQMLKASSKMDGIRIYFGVNYEGDLQGHQDVVLVGTKNNNEEGTHKSELEAQDDDENIYDTGTPCPPICPIGGIG